MFNANGFRLCRLLLAIILATGLNACGSNDSSKGGVVLDASNASSNDQATATGTISLALIQSGKNTLNTTNPSAPFTTDLPVDVAAVTVNSPAKVSFVIRDNAGNVVTGLQGANLRFAIAKLIPGTRGSYGNTGTGEADEWVSYIYRTKSGSAVTDGVQATFETGTDGTLEYDEENKYYSYTFATDLETVTRPDNTDLIWDATAVHRIAIQLELTATDGKLILYNPHFDFTFDAGQSVALNDTSLTHKVVDESACNECHNQLTAHGGRVETEYCVMCHNSGSIDVEFGSDLDFKVMIHRIHRGKSQISEYKIAGYGGVVHEWSDIGYPQDLRNCSKCHDAANPLTPQGDNWKLKPTQQACISCHENTDFNDHNGFDMISDADVRDNSRCAGCHAGNAFINSAHFNQAQSQISNYQLNIQSFNYDNTSRNVSVTYSISNPNTQQTYNLTAGLETCLANVNAGTAEADSCNDLEGAAFSRCSLLIGSLTVAGASPAIDEYTDQSASIYLWQGTDNGDGSYSAELTVPLAAVGTARLLSNCQAQERKITSLTAYNYALRYNTVITQINAASHGVDWDWNNRVKVPVENVIRDFSVEGSSIIPRREIVSDDKCNVCHAILGTATGSNTVANAFHNGGSSSVQACPVCHTPNLASTTDMSDETVDSVVIEPLIPGTATRMSQSYEFKTMIHAIHGGEIRKTSYLQDTLDLSAATHYPGTLSNCAACHENQSYRVSSGKLGSAVSREADPSQRHVFSPTASSCIGCHDSVAAREHMGSSGTGSASVGDFTQAQWVSGVIYERCGECHGPGGAKDVASVHAIKN